LEEAGRAGSKKISVSLAGQEDKNREFSTKAKGGFIKGGKKRMTGRLKTAASGRVRADHRPVLRGNSDKRKDYQGSWSIKLKKYNRLIREEMA